MQVDKIWSVKDIEAFEEMWGHEMNEFDWMGRTKSIEDIDNNDVSSLCTCFPRCVTAIRFLFSYSLTIDPLLFSLHF